MTVSANATYDPQRNTLIEASLQLCGLLPAGDSASARDLALGTNLLDMELKALQGEGIVLRTVERATVTLTAGTEEYTLPADTIDVVVDPNNLAGTIVPASGGSETAVEAMRANEWLVISNKTDPQGRPTRVYIEKQATVKLVFWPVPDTESATFRYLRVRLLRDMDAGDVTTDLPSRWVKVVTYGLAVHLARAKALESTVVTDLRREYLDEKAAVRSTDVERGPVQAHVRHRRYR